MDKSLRFFIGTIVLGVFYGALRRFMGFELTIIIMFATYMSYIFSREETE